MPDDEKDDEYGLPRSGHDTVSTGPVVLGEGGWKDVTMLRRYTAAVATELAQLAHVRYSPADRL